MVKYPKGRNATIHYLEGNVNIESDYEDDSTGVGDGTLEEGEIRAVLIVGSFSAYVGFLTLPLHQE